MIASLLADNLHQASVESRQSMLCGQASHRLLPEAAALLYQANQNDRQHGQSWVASGSDEPWRSMAFAFVLPLPLPQGRLSFCLGNPVEPWPGAALTRAGAKQRNSFLPAVASRGAFRPGRSLQLLGQLLSCFAWAIMRRLEPTPLNLPGALVWGQSDRPRLKRVGTVAPAEDLEPRTAEIRLMAGGRWMVGWEGGQRMQDGGERR